MDITPEEFEKRKLICRRKWENFAASMTINLGFVPYPIHKMFTLQGELDVLATMEFIPATDNDLTIAADIIKKANERYAERKAKKLEQK